MITNFKITTLLVSLGISLCCCSSEKKPRSENALVDSTVVLAVGDIIFTDYEFKKNLAVFKQTYKDEFKTPPSKAEINNWIQDYLAKAYFLADASTKGYYERKDIQEIVNKMENIILFQPDGLLEQKIFASLTPQSVKSEMEKSKRVIKLQYIQFPDKESANKINELSRKMTWQSVTKESAKAGFLNGQDTYQWPFKSLWSENKSIVELKKGQTSSLIKIANSYYLVYIEDIYDLPNAALNESQMEARLRQELLKKYYDRIQQQSQLDIDNEILSATFSRISSVKSFNTLEKKQFTDLLNRILGTYQLPNGHKQLILVDDFITYYNSLPVRTPITNATIIQHCLSSIAYGPFTKADAEKFGLNKDPKFILDKKNFTKQLVYARYEKDFLADTLPVSDIEVAHSYDSMKMKMIKPTHVRYSLFAFRNREDAMSGKIKLQFSGDNDKSVLKGLITSKRHQKVHFESKTIPDTLKRLLFSMKAGQISFPVAVNNDVVVMLKEEESGSRIPDLTEVKPFVIQEIKKRKMILKKKEVLSKLTKIYPKEDYLNYSSL